MEIMKNSTDERIRGLSNLIGNTPLLEIAFRYRGRKRKIHAKAENYNLTGSLKDRMALHILRRAYERGQIHPRDHIFEATSGNTGIAFSALGRFLGNPVTIFMPEWMSQERISLIKSYGAEIRLVSRDDGGFMGSIAMADDAAGALEGAFRPRQFDNPDNCDAHYITTGPEITRQLAEHNLKIDAFIAGVGTGGTVMGVGRYLREKDDSVKIHPIEPANSPTLSTGCKVGSHRIQGISDEFVPSIIDLAFLDDIIAVDDGDAIIMAQKLACDLGVGIGISSGANFLGAAVVQEKLGENSTVVTIFCDDNKKYLTTDLVRVESPKSGFISSDIELLSLRCLN